MGCRAATGAWFTVSPLMIMGGTSVPAVILVTSALSVPVIGSGVSGTLRPSGTALIRCTARPVAIITLTARASSPAISIIVIAR